jgi:allophanate hydrolase subunit 2
MGPQDASFTEAGLKTFLNQPFTISHLSDRMGLRLQGQAIEHSGSFDLISDGNAHGAIQVPGSGQPIVLMADRGTTGGYPKIATVISADLPMLGRLPPGAELRFKAVTHAEAVEALRAQDALLAQLKASVTPYRDANEELARALLEENIISGVADAQA